MFSGNLAYIWVEASGKTFSAALSVGSESNLASLHLKEENGEYVFCQGHCHFLPFFCHMLLLHRKEECGGGGGLGLLIVYPLSSHDLAMNGKSIFCTLTYLFIDNGTAQLKCKLIVFLTYSPHRIPLNRGHLSLFSFQPHPLFTQFFLSWINIFRLKT